MPGQGPAVSYRPLAGHGDPMADASADAATERAFSRLPQGLETPMLIVTVASDGERAGCLVGFASQISVHPGRFLACISIKNHTHGRACRAHSISVRVVPDSQPSLAELFGGETGDKVDKFTRCRWQPAADGTPLLDGCADRFVGSVITVSTWA